MIPRLFLRHFVELIHFDSTTIYTLALRFNFLFTASSQCYPNGQRGNLLSHAYLIQKGCATALTS